jgi:hypothetical protein
MDAGPEADSEHETVSTFLENATEPLYAIRPSAELIGLLARTALQRPTPPLHVLATESALNSLRRQFLDASHAAELISREQLTLTPSVPEGWGTAVANYEAALAVTQVADHQLAFETTAVPKKPIEACEELHEVGQRFDLRTPPWEVVTETLVETFGDTVRDEFVTAIEVMDSLMEPVIDEIGCALLVAARHELLLYDLGRWGEDIQLSSRATFSRAKGELDDAAVLESEKVQMDVGRPRLRLTLADEYASLSVSKLVREVNVAISD